uniref:ZP domain-containing protein n=1 Tax=Globodera rostochiensis TaxID=31243 RepID=A0A914GVG2_GLORO
MNAAFFAFGPFRRRFVSPASHSCLIFILLLLFPEGLRLISIDNDIIGEPDIECLDQEIRVWVRTRKFFQGRIYTKGKADDPECAKDDFSSRRTKKVHFDLRLGRCGMKSLRSFDPRGMYYGVTLVISFHPLFITKVDQAFHVKCFFEEAQRGLTAELGVSMIPTTEVEARHGIPGCSYSIHRSSIDDLDAGKPAGSAIQFARVGDKVLHQWHCDDQMFGILINNCFVTDGVKQKHRVIDEKGCPVDPIAITGIRYASDLQRAYAESQVFKFADRPGVWFFCQIQMCMKKEGMCDGITPPACATTNAPPKGIRGRIGTEKKKEEEDDEGGRGGKKGTEIEEGTEGSNSSTEPESVGRKRGEEEHVEFEEFGKRSTESPGMEVEGAGDEQTEESHASGGEAQSDGTPQPEHTTTQIASSLKQRLRENPSASMGGYGVPSPIGTADTEDQAKAAGVTAFGPGYLANQVDDGSFGVGRDPPGGVRSPHSSKLYIPTVSSGGSKGQQAAVSAEFETVDAQAMINRPTTETTTENGPTRDYADYDSDVTVPPNLTDLLANLQPEDISARSLQKMFRDSVIDRRTLLQGFDLLIRKMNKKKTKKDDEDDDGEENAKTTSGRRGGRQVTEEQENGREGEREHRKARESKQQRTARDFLSRSAVPLFAKKQAQPSLSAPNSGQWPDDVGERHSFRQFDASIDPPMIAGQLLIYDLDEKPPNIEELKKSAEDCPITRNGLTIALIGSGSLALILLLIAFAVLSMLPKQSTDGGEETGGTDAEGRKRTPTAGGARSAGDGGRWGSLYSAEDGGGEGGRRRHNERRTATDEGRP